jgi:hypothetical protein
MPAVPPVIAAILPASFMRHSPLPAGVAGAAAARTLPK